VSLREIIRHLFQSGLFDELRRVLAYLLVTSARKRERDPRINDDAFVSPRLASIDEPNLSANEKALIAVGQIVDMRRFFLRPGSRVFFLFISGEVEVRNVPVLAALLSQVEPG